jgi:hypothetical protein
MFRLVLGQVAGLTILVACRLVLQLVIAGRMTARTGRSLMSSGELESTRKNGMIDIGIVPLGGRIAEVTSRNRSYSEKDERYPSS